MLFLTCLLLIASSDVSAQEHTDWQQATSTASHQEYSFPSESGKLKKPPKLKTKKPTPKQNQKTSQTTPTKKSEQQQQQQEQKPNSPKTK